MFGGAEVVWADEGSGVVFEDNAEDCICGEDYYEYSVYGRIEKCSKTENFGG